MRILDAQRKERQGAGKEKGRERGIWDCCMLLSGVHSPPPPPHHHLSPILRATSGLEVLWGAPPPPITHNPFGQFEAIAVDL